MSETWTALGFILLFVIVAFSLPALLYANWGISILIRRVRQKRNMRDHP